MEHFNNLDNFFGSSVKKLEKRVRYLMSEYKFHTNVDIRSVHMLYLVLNGYVNDAINDCKDNQFTKEQIELYFWDKLELIQHKFLKDTASKQANDLKKLLKEKDVIKFRHAIYKKFPNEHHLSKQFSIIQRFVVGVIRALKEATSVGLLEREKQIVFFHCLEKFSPKLMGAAMDYFWSLYFGISHGGESPVFSLEIINPLIITMADINRFMEGKTCLLCNNLKPRKNESTSDTLRQHLKNCHDILSLKCNDCGIPMTCTKNLQEHMKKIHATPTFQCHLCSEKHMTKAALMVHLENDHHQKNVVFRGKERYLAKVEELRQSCKANKILETSINKDIRNNEAEPESKSTSSSSSSKDNPKTTPASINLRTIITPSFQTEKDLRFLSYEDLLKRDLLWQNFKAEVIRLICGTNVETSDETINSTTTANMNDGITNEPAETQNQKLQRFSKLKEVLRRQRSDFKNMLETYQLETLELDAKSDENENPVEQVVKLEREEEHQYEPRMKKARRISNEASQQ